MTRSVEVHLHVSSSRAVYDELHSESECSSISGKDDDDDMHGSTTKRHREAQGECEGDRSGLSSLPALGVVGPHDVFAGSSLHRRCLQTNSGNSPKHSDSGKRKGAYLGQQSSYLERVSPEGEARPLLGTAYGNSMDSSMSCKEASAVDACSGEGGSIFAGDNSAQVSFDQQVKLLTTLTHL